MIDNNIKKARPTIGLKGVYAAASPAKPPVSKLAMFFSTAELRQISDGISRDYAPIIKTNKAIALSKIKLSASEFLAISAGISRVFNPIPNQTEELLLLPLDPGRVYAYWIRPGKKPAMENPGSVGQHLALKLFPVDTHDGGGAETGKPVFEAAMAGHGQSRKIIALPAIEEDTRVVAVIGEQRPDQSSVVLTRSKPLHLSDHGPLEPAVKKKAPLLTCGAQSPVLSSANRQLTASGQR